MKKYLSTVGIVFVVGLLIGTTMMLAGCNGDEGENGNGGEATTTEAGAANIVEQGDTIFVIYTGRLADGTVFDSNADGGQPLTFIAGAGQMIPGFDAAVLGMELNEEKTIQIPADQAYGEQGVPDPATGEYLIPPNSDIEFDVQVIEIRKAGAEAEAPAAE